MNNFVTMLGNLQFIECVEPQEVIVEKIAYQPLLEREVIVKRLTRSAADNPRLRSCFIRDARTLAGLRHSNIVHVYEAGMDNDLPYVILEKPNGMVLRQRLDFLTSQRIRLNTEEIARIMLDVANAVEYTHQHHVLVHDLSPDNIILTTTGQAVLTGLGGCLPENILNISMTMLAYASPERLLGEPVDNRSDVYALGVLLYHLLFGRLPFEGNVLGIIAQKQNSAIFPTPDSLGVELFYPETLSHVVQQATAPKPQQRYADVATLRTALMSALNNQLQSVFSNLTQNGASPQHMHHAGQMSFKPANGSNGATSVIHEATLNSPIVARNGTTAAPVKERIIGESLFYPSNGHAPAKTEQKKAKEETVTQTVSDAPISGNDEPIGRASAIHSTIDPAMPGYDQPSLHAALPYTTLVPMPGTIEPAQAPLAASVEKQISPKYATWGILGMSLLGLLTIIAATQFG